MFSNAMSFAVLLSLALLPVISGAPVADYQDAGEAGGETTDMTIPIFVINLEYRKERLERLDKQAERVGGLSYIRINAADPDYANEALAAGKARVNDTYLDPFLGRKMKIGEVGCALSHLKSWEAIADTTLPDDAYAIVLEDDVEITDEFVVDREDVSFGHHLDVIAAAAFDHGVDFVYLSYRGMNYDEREDVDNIFSTCVYDYWANAYMIRAGAARRLVSDAESYRMNLIPSDEYLPIVLGTLDAPRTSYGSTVKENSTKSCARFGSTETTGSCDVLMSGQPQPENADPRYPNVRLSCFSLKEQIFRPSDAFEVISDTEYSPIAKDVAPQDSKKGLLVVTFATDESHYGYQNFLRSAEYYGYRLKTLGSGREWTGGDIEKDEGGGNKLSSMKQLLHDLHIAGSDENGDRLILVTDGYDTMFQLTPTELLERYSENKADVIFGAEMHCFPESDLCAEYENLLEKSGDDVDNYYFPYLNSGAYIGKAKHLNELLQEVDDVPHSDYQRYFFSKLVAQLKQDSAESDLVVGLDFACELFQTIKDVPSDGWGWNDANVVYNKLTDSTPVLLHGNGRSKRTLIGIGNYIAGGHTDFYGSRQHVLLNADQVDLYPLAIGIFFSGTPFEAEFLESVASLDLDWAQVSLHVYYGPNSRLRISNKSGGMHTNITVLEAGESECLARSFFLEKAQESEAHYAFMIDSNTMVDRPGTIMDLARWNKTVVAGHAQRKQEHFSNYWSNMDDDGWYEDGFDSLDLYRQDKVGLWQVPFASSLLLFRADTFGEMAKLYGEHENSMDDCSRLVCIDAMETPGIPFYVDNRYQYGTLLGNDGLVNPDAEFPELYEVETNPTLWTRRYMVPDYENIQLDEVCPDVYGAVLFTPRFCEELIATVEGEENWSSGDYDDERLASGYEPYPTQDIHMHQFDWETQWTYILEEIFAPLINEYYEGVAYDGGFNIAFVIRYIMSGQRELDPHHDASHVTTTVQLNEDFTGGGVLYTRYNCSLKAAEPGFFSMHPGQVTHNHKAFPITSGKRYVLVSFNE